jgi:hypothetical protein
MQRRTFLSFSLVSATLGAIRAGGSQNAQTTSDGKGREFYELRRYQLYNGAQKKICDDYFKDALLPAVNRLGITPVGVFNLTVGPETPAIYVLLPSSSLDTLVTLEVRLAQDTQYLKAGTAFLNAPAAEPAFVRMESSLMQAFEKMPGLVLPPATATNGARVFELRTYESPSDQDHKRKVEMMQSGEEAIFAKAGFSQVFYGDTLIGSRMPNLTYMLSYQSVSERDKLWAAFASAPDWKALSSQSRYAFEAIVSNITNVLLAPAPYSQI